MRKGMDVIHSKMPLVDVIIEVHDARIPFSGRPEIFQKFELVRKPRINLLLVTGYHQTAFSYVAPLLCGLNLQVKRSGISLLRKPPVSAWAPGEYPSPHINRMIYVAHIYLVPHCTNVYVFK
ncbi:unnamed protein product [Schistosoma curassoni]|uniref:Uncharacterized protein n=1 Tax=Schistosoma curassoni TaxID=6186 RepID=A0A183JMT7_9TREM|nr:unnamed protein product [Schistosoma curassoni]